MNSTENHTIKCLSCNQSVTVTQDQIGSKFTCPSCRVEGIVGPLEGANPRVPEIVIPAPVQAQPFSHSPQQAPQAPTPTEFGSAASISESHSTIASEQALMFLSQGKGWVRFHSVILIIAVVGMFFAITVVLRLGSVYSRSSLMFIPLMLILVSIVITIFQAVFLSKFASSCARLDHTRNPLDLENALVAQMNYWRLTGILVCISIALFLLSLLS